MPLGELVVVRDDHPALADRQVLVREEAEAADEPERAAASPAARSRPARAPRPRSPSRPRSLGDLAHGVHVARVAAVVQDDARPSSAGPTAASRSAGSRFRSSGPEDVAEDRRRPGVRDRVRGGDEVERRQRRPRPPGPQPTASSARWSAAVPLATANACSHAAELGEGRLELRAPAGPCSTSPSRRPRPRPHEARRRRGRRQGARPTDCVESLPRA